LNRRLGGPQNHSGCGGEEKNSHLFAMATELTEIYAGKVAIKCWPPIGR